jgi:high affinity choline transporter 7
VGDIFWPGLAAVAVFYVVVFVIGAWAGRIKGPEGTDGVEELLLAGRSLPLWIGLMTMTATWVGGGYVNGAAQEIYTGGLVKGIQAPLGYALSLVVGGLFYAGVMRRYRFSTLVDPLEMRFGKEVAGLLVLPAVLAEVFWSAAILVALGTTFGTVMGLDLAVSIVVSSVIAIGYTVLGGLRAVAYTDVVQLILMIIGLVITVPFAVRAAGGFSMVADGVVTPLPTGLAAVAYGDMAIMLIFGGIPWNSYFQRVLACRTDRDARNLSIGAGLLCLACAVPPLLLGAVARSLDWTALAGPEIAAELAAKPTLVLPFLLRYAVPPVVAMVGLGAVAAAVMSSVDSSILSAAALAVHNGARRLFWPQLSLEGVVRAVRAGVVGFGALATLLAVSTGSVAELWYLSGDLVYCLLFPALTLALFDKGANRTGAVAAVLVALLLRIGGGVPAFGIPQWLPYPDWSPVGEFPFRTLAMIAGFVAAIGVSRVTASFDPPMPLRSPES